jgi:hypothetical protein
MTDEKILDMDLGKAIAACKEEGILTDETVNLCTVVRKYRNLIHPGRVKLNAVDVDDQHAMIAFSLVEIILKELTARRKDAFGITAEEIIDKLVKDPGTTVLEQLLRDMKSRELERLAIKVLPQKMLDDGVHSRNQGKWHETRMAYGKCFRLALSIAPELRPKAIDNYVLLLRTGARPDIQIVDRYLVSFEVFSWATPEQFHDIKAHILDIMPWICEEGIASTWASGICMRLTAAEVRTALPSWLRGIVINKQGSDSYIDTKDLFWLAREFQGMGDDAQVATAEVVTNARNGAHSHNKELLAHGYTEFLQFLDEIKNGKRLP